MFPRGLAVGTETGPKRSTCVRSAEGHLTYQERVRSGNDRKSGVKPVRAANEAGIFQRESSDVIDQRLTCQPTLAPPG